MKSTEQNTGALDQRLKDLGMILEEYFKPGAIERCTKINFDDNILPFVMEKTNDPNWIGREIWNYYRSRDWFFSVLGKGGGDFNLTKPMVFQLSRIESRFEELCLKTSEWQKYLEIVFISESISFWKELFKKFNGPAMSNFFKDGDDEIQIVDEIYDILSPLKEVGTKGISILNKADFDLINEIFISIIKQEKLPNQRNPIRINGSNTEFYNPIRKIITRFNLHIKTTASVLAPYISNNQTWRPIEPGTIERNLHRLVKRD